ncbi:MAG: hypothetical protein ACRDPJ_18940 [Nocardioidaceae bacterium]
MAQELNPLIPSSWELVATIVVAGIVSLLVVTLLVLAIVRLTSSGGHSEAQDAKR